MPYSQVQAYTTTGDKASVGLDPAIAPFSASVAFEVGDACNYKLQYTLNPLADPLAVDSDATWIDSLDIPAGSTATLVATFNFPVARVRAVIASISGTLTMRVLQGLSTN